MDSVGLGLDCVDVTADLSGATLSLYGILLDALPLKYAFLCIYTTFEKVWISNSIFLAYEGKLFAGCFGLMLFAQSHFT